MRVLFVVSRMKETGTVFRLAERMAGDGLRVVFLFTRGGCRHAADPELMGALRFAEDIYVLGDDCRSMGVLSRLAEGVEIVDYGGWVELLEACDRVVSWT